MYYCATDTGGNLLFYRHLRVIALLLLACIPPSAYLISQLTIDNRQEKLVNQSGEAARLYQQFKQDFGHDEFVIVALSGHDLFDEDVLDELLDIAESLEQIPQVASVNGLPVIYRDLFGAEDPEALFEEMTSTPFYRNLLISDDHAVAGLMLQLRELQSVAERGELVEAVEQVAAAAEDLGFRVDLVGQPMFSVAINRITSTETGRTFPIAGIAALLILLFLLRSVAAALAVLICGGLSLLYTMAVVSIIGWSMNLITTSLPLVLFVLAIANGIHVASRFQRSLHDIPDRAAAMDHTLRQLGMSCLLSSLTTALGFLSLMVADLDAISQMGVYMSLGILFSLLTNFTIGAWLLVNLPVPAASGAGAKLGTWLRQRTDVAMRKPWHFIAAFALIAVWGVYGLSKLSSSGDGMQFLPKGHPLTESHRFVSEHLTGLTAVEVVVDVPGGWLSRENWPALEQLTSELRDIETTRRVYGPLDILKKMHQWYQGGDAENYRLPNDQPTADELIILLDDQNADQLSAYAAPDGDRVRISVLADLQGDTATSELIDQIDTVIARLPESMRAHSTGISVQMRSLGEGLLTTQLTSYGLAFLLIFSTIGLGLRSRHLPLLSILPNVIPMLVIFGLMASFEIALNTATVMVASISLGIAVDNTVHVLTRFRRQRQQGEAAMEACESTIFQVGPSITITTATACIGFYALLPSAFEPISNLGLLSGSAVLAALVANLLLLPAMISLSPLERDNPYA